MNKVKLTLCLLVGLGLSGPAGATEKPPTDPPVISLAQAIKLALERNPQLKSKEFQHQAKQAMAPQAGSLPDPELSFGLLNLPTDSFSRTQEGMTMSKISLSQRFPFPGKLSLKEDSAQAEASSALSNTKEFRLQLQAKVSQTWWELFYLDQALDVVRENQNLLRQFVTIAKTKYLVGKGLQQDALLAEVELSKLLDAELKLKIKRDNQVALFNHLLYQPAGSSVNLPLQVEPNLPPLLPLPSLFELGKKHRPWLEAQREKVKAAQARVDFAHKDYMPNFKFGLEYGQRKGRNLDGSARANLASIKFGMSIPLFASTKQSEAVKQREFELSDSQSALQSKETQVLAQIAAMEADYRHGVEETQLYASGIIPQTRQAVGSMKIAYQVGKVDFLNLVRMQITLFNYQTQYWRVLSSSEQTLAKLTAFVGTDQLYAQPTQLQGTE